MHINPTLGLLQRDDSDTRGGWHLISLKEFQHTCVTRILDLYYMNSALDESVSIRGQTFMYKLNFLSHKHVDVGDDVAGIDAVAKR